MELDASAAPGAPGSNLPPNLVHMLGNQYEEAVDMVNPEWIRDGWRIHSFNSMKVNQDWCACINWTARKHDNSTAWYNHEIWRLATPTIWPTGIKYELGRPNDVIFTWWRKPRQGGLQLPGDNAGGGANGSDDSTNRDFADPPSCDAMDTGDDALPAAPPGSVVPPPPLPPSASQNRTVSRSPEKRRCIKM